MSKTIEGFPDCHFSVTGRKRCDDAMDLPPLDIPADLLPEFQEKWERAEKMGGVEGIFARWDLYLEYKIVTEKRIATIKTVLAGKLKAYCGFVWEPEEGAVLVFAENAQRAKAIAYPEITSWTDAEYIEVRVRRVRTPHIFAYGDQEKLASGVSHVVDGVASCRSCDKWGVVVGSDDVCEHCSGSAGFNPKTIELIREYQAQGGRDG